MREIKFRFWDEFVNRMRIPVGYLAQYLIFDEWKDRHFTSGVVMQYTGLKDSKGIEIYEGDILQANFYPGHNYYMVIGKDTEPPYQFVWWWKVKPNAKVKGISDGLIQDLGYMTFSNKEVEVIGNIYENKDLLEV